jgi:hypothetical protein
MALMIRVTMPDKSVWQVPASVVSEDAIAYYSKQDDFTEEEAADWRKDTGEILDWGKNNMNWEDVAAHATRLPTKPPAAPDYQEGWVNGKWKFVMVEDEAT